MVRTSLTRRLMTYFLVIALVPIICLTIFYYTSVSRTVNENLSIQADAALSRIITNIESTVEEYRHRSYEIAANEIVVSALTDTGLEDTRELYQQLYQTMRGTIYDASAHVVSADGRKMFSTHEYPRNYDIRYHSNDDSVAALLDRLEDQPMLLLNQRYVNPRNDIVLLNILRAVRDETEQIIGYVIVDIFSSSLTRAGNEPIFRDILLIDNQTLTASSLLQTDIHGDFSHFPALIEEASDSQVDTVRISSDHIIAQRSIPGTNLAIAGIIETAAYTIVLDRISLLSMVIMAISALGALLLAYISSNHITRPISRLVEAMKRVESGDLESSLAIPAKTQEIHSLTKGFNEMIVQIRELIDLTKEEERQLREAERKALQAQINPHFLYNTLYTIKALANLHGQEQILQISSALGKLLRSSISSESDTLPLSESLDLVRDYLTIAQIRYPKRLKCKVDANEELTGQVTPKFMIQPFVENAISHGLEPVRGPWHLRIYLYRWHSRTAISIIDDGIGFDTDTIMNPTDGKDSHIGIMNVKRRLELYYQGKAEIRITSRKQVGTVVQILLPNKEA